MRFLRDKDRLFLKRIKKAKDFMSLALFNFVLQKFYAQSSTAFFS